MKIVKELKAEIEIVETKSLLNEAIGKVTCITRDYSMKLNGIESFDLIELKFLQNFVNIQINKLNNNGQ